MSDHLQKDESSSTSSSNPAASTTPDSTAAPTRGPGASSQPEPPPAKSQDATQAPQAQAPQAQAPQAALPPPVQDFAGKVAIITGGGTGLGRAMALNLAGRGARVVISSRSQEHLDKTAAEITAAGGQVMTITCNVTDAKQVETMVNQVIASYGRIDILVNNAAGNFLRPAKILSPNGWFRVIDIVLNGTFYCSKFAGEQMLKQGSGRILNIVANYADTGQPGVIHSAAAKNGVLSLTRTLAVEWGPHGLRVNAFAPGSMITDGASANLKFDTPEMQEKIRKRIPIQRFTSPEEMARQAVYLCSDDADCYNGAFICADGGFGLPRGFMEIQDF